MMESITKRRLDHIRAHFAILQRMIGELVLRFNCKGFVSSHEFRITSNPPVKSNKWDIVRKQLHQEWSGLGIEGRLTAEPESRFGPRILFPLEQPHEPHSRRGSTQSLNVEGAPRHVAVKRSVTAGGCYGSAVWNGTDWGISPVASPVESFSESPKSHIPTAAETFYHSSSEPLPAVERAEPKPRRKSKEATDHKTRHPQGKPDLSIPGSMRLSAGKRTKINRRVVFKCAKVFAIGIFIQLLSAPWLLRYGYGAIVKLVFALWKSVG
jgi:hypothetical protein